MINYGSAHGKLAVVADILDENRVLLDGPHTGIAREVYPLKRVSLTDIRVNILKGATTGTVRKAWEAAKVGEAFAKTSWGKKLASHTRRTELNDFERFNAMILKKRKNFAIRHPGGAKKKK